MEFQMVLPIASTNESVTPERGFSYADAAKKSAEQSNLFSFTWNIRLIKVAKTLLPVPICPVERLEFRLVRLLPSVSNRLVPKSPQAPFHPSRLTTRHHQLLQSCCPKMLESLPTRLDYPFSTMSRLVPTMPRLTISLPIVQVPFIQVFFSSNSLNFTCVFQLRPTTHLFWLSTEKQSNSPEVWLWTRSRSTKITEH